MPRPPLQRFSPILSIAKEKALAIWAKIVRATLDLTLSFFPVFVLAFILIVDERLDDMARMSDVIFLAATLFAEGAWRLHCATADGARLPDHESLFLVGILGTTFSCLIAVLMVYADGPHYADLKALVAKRSFLEAKASLCVAAAVFGFAVRYKLQARPSGKA